LLVEIVEAMIEEGLFPESARAHYAREYAAWLDREGAYERYINAVVESFITHLQGVHYGDFSDLGDTVIDRHGKQLYRYTRDLITTLKRDGYYLVAISQSPKTVLDKFCDTLGFDKVYGRMYELGPSDKFTGKVMDEHLISNKANIVRRVVEKNGLTFAGSVGVGDTEGDISMLELVENPICFNPNKELYQYAKMNHWRVVVERKDVIYTIQEPGFVHDEPTRELAY
jgi:HAD superfamily phosphoserine phosphatase-like hydrolase